jgi:hypothetical protein
VARMPFTADNGDALAPDEAMAIARLKMIARDWPQTLALVSMDGQLSVIRPGNVIGDPVLADIQGIPTDGGAW